MDLIGAIVMGLKPRFEPVNSALPYPDLEDSEPCLMSARYQSKMSNLTGLKPLSQEAAKVYRLLRHLIIDKESVAGLQEMKIPESEFQSLQLYTYQLMYRLIALVHYEIPASNLNALIYGLFGNAGLVHILMFTCNSPLPIRDPALISARIRASLDMINIQAFQLAYPEMMLWIIIMGGLASMRSENQAWFIKLLAESCRAVGIAGTVELALSLSDFLWSEFYLGPIFTEFWVKVKKEIRNNCSST